MKRKYKGKKEEPPKPKVDTYASAYESVEVMIEKFKT